MHRKHTPRTVPHTPRGGRRLSSRAEIESGAWEKCHTAGSTRRVVTSSTASRIAAGPGARAQPNGIQGPGAPRLSRCPNGRHAEAGRRSHRPARHDVGGRGPSIARARQVGRRPYVFDAQARCLVIGVQRIGVRHGELALRAHLWQPTGRFTGSLPSQAIGVLAPAVGYA